MTLAPDYKPEFESLKRLLLDMAQERSVAALIKTIVGKLAQRPHVAHARIWLIGSGDCPCPKANDQCPDDMPCLKLAASSGQSITETDVDWCRIDGEFSRFPIGERKVGWMAANGKPVEVRDIKKDSKWIARPEWVEREGILGFGGQPLVFRKEVLGVMAIFTRIRLVREELIWMRMIADHAAAAMVNARAFEEIAQLKNQLELEASYLREELRDVHAYGDFIGQSAAMQNVLKQVGLVAPTDANVLIQGESGTGKELVAREIHHQSQRRERPLIKVNCAAIARELYESEFFGHVKGAFSGALKNRAGRFEAADGGTLFLDEVGEIPLDLQSKLLRVLQEGMYERVGEETTRQVDVRIIAATNKNLKHEVGKGRFRQDLYYRLNVFPIEVAPLRNRKKDIPLLAEHFIFLISRKTNRPIPKLTQSNLLQLQGYDWPGNVRELQNIIERALITRQGGVLEFKLQQDTTDHNQDLRPSPPVGQDRSMDVLPDTEIRRQERRNTIAALKKTGWKVYGPGGAAQLLGIKPTTLSSRIKKMGIDKPTGF